MLSATMLAMSAVGIVVLAAGLRQQKTHWNLTASYVLGVGLVVNSAAAIAIYQGRYAIVYDPFEGYNVRVLRTAESPLFGYAIAAATVLSLMVLAYRLAQRQPLRAPALLAAALSAVMTLANDWAGSLPSASIGSAFMLAVLLGASTLTPGKGAWLGAATLMLVIAIASGLFTAWRPDDGARPCGLDKCGQLDVLIQGLTSSENAFALLIALALPFAWYAFDGAVRTWALLYGLVWLALIGSRTSLVACGAFLLLLLALRFRATAHTAAHAALGVGVIVSLTLPWLSFIEPDTFSLRGTVWALARQRVQDAWLLGYGADDWPKLVEQGYIPSGAVYSPHNQWLEVAYAAGLVGVVVFTFWLRAIIRAGAADDIRRTAVLLFPALVVGTTERAWSFGLPDWLTWALVAICLASPQKEEGGDGLRDRGVDRDEPKARAGGVEHLHLA